MYKELYIRLMNSLKSEMDYIIKFEKDENAKLNKMTEIYRITKIIDNFDELEPTMQEFFEEKKKKQKWEER